MDVPVGVVRAQMAPVPENSSAGLRVAQLHFNPAPLLAVVRKLPGSGDFDIPHTQPLRQHPVPTTRRSHTMNGPTQHVGLQYTLYFSGDSIKITSYFYYICLVIFIIFCCFVRWRCIKFGWCAKKESSTYSN